MIGVRLVAQAVGLGLIVIGLLSDITLAILLGAMVVGCCGFEAEHKYKKARRKLDDLEQEHLKLEREMGLSEPGKIIPFKRKAGQS